MSLPDSDDLATYTSASNGDLQDFSFLIDPESELDAAGIKQFLSTVAMGSRTATRAWVVFQVDAGDCDVTEHNAVWGSGEAVEPTVEEDATGVFTITWPEEVDDALGTTHSVNIRRAKKPNVEGSTIYITNATKLTANTVEVRITTHAGAATSPQNTDIYVEVV
jgi:hypothetical protein